VRRDPPEHAAAPSSRRLTSRQAAFVAAYAFHGNAARAYRDAGYKDRGAEGRHSAYRLLQMCHISTAVERERIRIVLALAEQREWLGSCAQVLTSRPIGSQRASRRVSNW
jgi:hypothetical protein